MLKRIVQGLAIGEEHVVPNVRAQGAIGQVRGDILPAAQRHPFEKLVREPADILGEARKVVVFRVRRPDDLVQGLDGAASLRADALEPASHRREASRPRSVQIAELRHLREHASDVIVHVLRDAQALPLDRVPGFEQGQPAAEFPLIHEPNGDDCQHQDNRPQAHGEPTRPQNDGSMVIASATPRSFQRPSALQAVT